MAPYLIEKEEYTALYMINKRVHKTSLHNLNILHSSHPLQLPHTVCKRKKAEFETVAVLFVEASP